VRSEFERDRDRVIHSVAFRRLQGKTQIFASHLVGPMRTRLTHTLEVAQIGRAIGERLNVPAHLVEAACLAHDLGHPPFGHFGEGALSEAMLPYGGFDSNAQSFRIVTRLEAKNRKYAGINLCRATLLGILKYPYERTAAAAGGSVDVHRDLRRVARPGSGDDWVAGRRFVYDDDQDLVRELLSGTGVQLLRATDRDGTPPRTLVCQIMDWADDVAYSVHDLEDGLVAGFLNPSEITTPGVVDAVVAALTRPDEADVGTGGSVDRGDVGNKLGALASALQTEGAPENIGGLRKVTRAYINKFILMTRVVPTDPAERGFGFRLELEPGHRLETEVLKALTREYLIKDPRTTRYMFKGRHMIKHLFDAFMEHHHVIDDSVDQLLDRYDRRLIAAADGDEGVRARVVCDYLAGLTEGQLIALYQTMFESQGGLSLPAR
jgi:dGTPase